MENDIAAVKEFSFKELIIVREHMANRTPLYIATLLNRSEQEVKDLMSDLGAITRRIQEKHNRTPVKIKAPAQPKIKKEKPVRVPVPPAPPRVKAITAKHQTWRGSAAISKKITEESRERPGKKEKFYKPPGNNDMKKGPLFKTREVDLNTKIRVVIDKRTTIYINAGQDPEEARENYLAKYSKH